MRVSASCFYDENVKIGSENVVLMILWYKAFQALLSVKCQNQESLYTCLLLLLKSTLFVIWTQSNEKKVLYICVSQDFLNQVLSMCVWCTCLRVWFITNIKNSASVIILLSNAIWFLKKQKLSMHRKWLILVYEEIVKYSVQKIVYRI